MIEVISRTANDDRFTFALLEQLVESLTCDYRAYYIWSNPPDVLRQFLTQMDFGQTPNVILGIKDTLDMWLDFNFWHDHAQAGVALLDETANRWPDTNFVVFTSLENITAEHITASNIQFVPWGGDLTNQIAAYEQLEPVLDKNFDSERSFIALNRNSRDHRVLLLSYLYATGLHQHGHVSFLQAENLDYSKVKTELLDRTNWEFTMPRHEPFRDTVIEGYRMISHNPELYNDHYQIYERPDSNDNIGNFNQNLRPLYRNSFVEIVTETTYASPAYLLTEKTWHAFSGCNFPIFLIGAGGVSHLRSLGLDVFDDVVNHDYDLIANPIDRLIAAIELNRGLLTSTDAVKAAWEERQQRFAANIAVTQTIGAQYRQRAHDRWQQLVWRH